jgi:polysaccharide export outer membrane protein
MSEGKRIALAWLLAAPLALVGAGCAGNLRETPTAGALETAAHQATEEYRIGPRDLLTINVWRQPELSVESVEVRLDGKVSVPLVDDVQAAGLTALELKEVLTKRLSEFVTAPHVTVVVRETRSKLVYVQGEVTREGAVAYQPEMRVFDAITLAGGFRPFSSKNNVKVIRLKPDGTSQEFRFNYDSFVRGSNLEQNVLLLPGDRIIVPQESPFLFR